MTDKAKKPGQPTKYKEEYCAKIIAFFDVTPWGTSNGKRVYKRMPTIEGFAKAIGICISTVDNWTNEEHDSFQAEFLGAYNKAMTYRKSWLIDVGLSGLAPANSFKFVAVNCTDMRDKVDTVHGVSNDLNSLLNAICGKTRGLP